MKVRTLSLAAALSFAVIAGGCSEKKNDTLAQDSALSRDLQLANSDSAAQPQLTDVAPNQSASSSSSSPARRPPASTSSGNSTPPRSTTPTKTASGNTVERSSKGSEPENTTIPAGTSLTLASNSKVCTNTAKAGDRFTANVTSPVTTSTGVTIPAGATAVLQVASVSHSDNATEPIKMVFSVLSIGWNGKSYPVDAAITKVAVTPVRKGGKDAQKVIGGAVLGGILGQVIGHNTKSTVIGAAAGAAAGTAVAMGTANYEGCVNDGANLTIKLNSPATVQAE